MENLKALVLRLAEHDCRFVIAGGFGVVTWGGSLLTRDVDLACDMSPRNLYLVWHALEEFAPFHRMTPERLPFTRQQAEMGGLKNLHLSTQLGQIDLLGEIQGVGEFEKCREQSVFITIGSKRIRVLTLDALILAKRSLGRPKDLHAVLELEVIREKTQREKSTGIPNPEENSA